MANKPCHGNPTKRPANNAQYTMATRWRETAGGQSCWPTACLRRDTGGLGVRRVKAEGVDAIKEGKEERTELQTVSSKKSEGKYMQHVI